MSELVTGNEGQSLIELDEAKRHIALARDMAMAEELHEWRDRAAAMAHYAKMRGDSQEAANQAAEIKVRAEAALGALDREQRTHGGNRVSEQAVPNTTCPPADLGVSTKTRANWRKLGALDEQQLDKVIEQVKATDDTISTAAVVKAATKASKIDGLRDAAVARARAQQEADAAMSESDREKEASTMAQIAAYQPTSEFVTTHALLASQAIEAIAALPEMPANEKGAAALRLAASQYHQVAEAISTFTRGNE